MKSSTHEKFDPGLSRAKNIFMPASIRSTNISCVSYLYVCLHRSLFSEIKLKHSLLLMVLMLMLLATQVPQLLMESPIYILAGTKLKCRKRKLM
jgi:type IV secretory pathway TrbL component